MDRKELLTENWRKNKWKIFQKTEYKKMIIKYLRITPPLEQALKHYSDKTWLSQSYIMAEALKEYLLKNKND